MQEVWVQSLVRELGSHKNIKKWEQYCNKLKTLKIVNIKKKKEYGISSNLNYSLC